MTDTKALRDKIQAAGLKYKYVAEKLGITPYSLKLKIENDNEFKVSEVDAISEILGLSLREKDAIFLPNSGIKFNKRGRRECAEP